MPTFIIWASPFENDMMINVPLFFIITSINLFFFLESIFPKPKKTELGIIYATFGTCENSKTAVQKCILLTATTSLEYLTFTVQFDVCAEFDIRRLFSHSSVAVEINVFSKLVLI